MEPVYKSKDGQIVTKSQLISSGYSEDRISKGLSGGVLSQVADTRDSYVSKDGQTVSYDQLLQSGYTHDRIVRGIENGILKKKDGTTPSAAGTSPTSPSSSSSSPSPQPPRETQPEPTPAAPLTTDIPQSDTPAAPPVPPALAAPPAMPAQQPSSYVFNEDQPISEIQKAADLQNKTITSAGKDNGVFNPLAPVAQSATTTSPDLVAKAQGSDMLQKAAASSLFDHNNAAEDIQSVYNDFKDFPMEAFGLKDANGNAQFTQKGLLQLRQQNPIEYQSTIGNLKTTFGLIKSAGYDVANSFNQLNKVADNFPEFEQKTRQQVALLTANLPDDQRQGAIDRLKQSAAQFITPASKGLQEEYQQDPLNKTVTPTQYAGLKTLQLFEPLKYQQAVNFLTTPIVPQYEHAIPVSASQYVPNGAVSTYTDTNPEGGKPAQRTMDEQIGQEIVGRSITETGRQNTITALNSQVYTLGQKLSELKGGSDPAAYNAVVGQYNNTLGLLKSARSDAALDDQRFPLTAKLAMDDQAKEFTQKALGIGEYSTNRVLKTFTNTSRSIGNLIMGALGSDQANARWQREGLGQAKEYSSEMYLPSSYQDENAPVQIQFSTQLQEQRDNILKDRGLSDTEKDTRIKDLLALHQNDDQVSYITNPLAGKSKNFFTKAKLYSNMGMLSDIAGIATQSMMAGGLGLGQTAAAIVPMYLTTQNDFYNEAVAKGYPNPNEYANMHSIPIVAAGLINPDIAIVRRALGNTAAGRMVAGMEESTWNRIIQGGSATVQKIKNSLQAVGGEALKMGAVYGAGVAGATDLINSQGYGEHVSGRDLIDHMVQSTKDVTLSSLALYGINAITHYKDVSPDQKAAIWEAGDNLDVTTAHIDEMLRKGQLSEDQAIAYKKAANEVSGLMPHVPQDNAKGKPMTDSQRADYLYNLLIKNKINKNIADGHLPTATVERLQALNQKIDQENEDALNSPASQQLKDSYEENVNQINSRTDLSDKQKEELKQQEDRKHAENIANSLKPQPAPEDHITVGDMVDKQVSLNGVRGSLYQDGQTIVFKQEGANKERELGNIDQIKDLPLKHFGLTHEESVVSAAENGNMVVRGKEYVNNYSNPTAAINYDKDGNIVSVNLETPDGKKRTFQGAIAEDLAYQIHLKEISKDAKSKQSFEDHLNGDEETKTQAESGGFQEPAPGDPAVDPEEVRPAQNLEPKFTVGQFADRIARGEKMTSPEDVQFYENNKAEIEQTLIKLKEKDQPAAATTAAQSPVADTKQQAKDVLDSSPQDAPWRKSDIMRSMSEQDPEEFLKNIAQQASNSNGTTVIDGVEKSARQSTVDMFGEDLVKAAEDFVNKAAETTAKPEPEQSTEAAGGRSRTDIEKEFQQRYGQLEKDNPLATDDQKEEWGDSDPTLKKLKEEWSATPADRKPLVDNTSSTTGGGSVEPVQGSAAAVGQEDKGGNAAGDTDSGDTGGGEPPKGAPAADAGEPVLEPWTGITKAKMQDIEDMRRIYEREPGTTWTEIQQRAMENLIAQHPGMTLAGAVRIRVEELAHMYESGVEYNPTKSDLAITEEFIRQTQHKMILANERLKSADPLTRDMALLDTEGLWHDLATGGKALYTREAATSFAFRQSIVKTDENYGFVIRRAQMMKENGGEPLSPEQEKKAEDRWKKDQEFNKKEQELRAKAQDEKAEKKMDQQGQKDKQDKGSKGEDKNLKEKGKEIADYIRKLKKPKGGLSIDITAGTWDMAVEAVAKLVEAGFTVSDAIEKAIGDKTFAFKADKDKKEFTREVSRSIETQKRWKDASDHIVAYVKASHDTTVTQDMVDSGVVKDFVNSHIGKYPKPKIMDEAYRDLKKILPDLTREKLLNAYLKEGEFKPQTKMQVQTELKRQQQVLRDIARQELKADVRKKNQLVSDKRKAEFLVNEYKRKLQDKEFEDHDIVPVHTKADAELIRLQMDRRQAEQAYHKEALQHQLASRRWYNKALSLVRSAYVAVLIGGPQSFARIATMAIARPLLEAMSKRTMGKVFDAVMPGISKAALSGGESSSLRSVKESAIAWMYHMGPKTMERRFNEAKVAYDAAATRFEQAVKDGVKGDQLKELREDMTTKLINAQSNLIYQYIGGSSYGDALQALQHRANKIEAQFGHIQNESIRDGGVTDKIAYVANFVGRSHSALKTFSGRASYAAGFIARLEGAVRKGVDITDPDRVLEIAAESYHDFERGKYQQSNYVSDLWNRVISGIDKNNAKNPEWDKFNQPVKYFIQSDVAVTRVPVNILHEAVMEYALGSFRSIAMARKEYKAARSEVLASEETMVNSPEFKQKLKEQIEQMDPDRAATIARCFRKGGMGLGLFAIIMLSKQVHFGGYQYLGQPHKKEESEMEPGELNPGQVMIGNTRMGEITSSMIDHVPAFYLTFMAMGWRHMYQDNIDSGKTTAEAASKASLNAVKSIEGSIPQLQFSSPLKFYDKTKSMLEKRGQGAIDFFTGNDEEK